MPNRSNSVDHMLGRQVITSGDLRISGFTAFQGAAFHEKLGTRRTMNRTINATAAEQRVVRRVNDCIDREGGDVTLENLDSFAHDSHLILNKLM